MEQNEIERRVRAIFEASLVNTRRVRAMVVQKFGDGTDDLWSTKCSECGREGRELNFPETVKATRGADLVAVWKDCRECDTRASLTRSGVPKNLLHCTLGNFRPDPKDQEVIPTVLRYIDGGVGMLVIESPEFGNGKTHLAVGILRWFVAAGHTGRFTTHANFGAQIRARYDDKSLVDPVVEAKYADLLVIDEMGLCVAGDDIEVALHSALNERHGSKRPTVFTTNFTREKFRDSVGPRMASRLRESTFAWLTLHGPSQRAERRREYLVG